MVMRQILQTKILLYTVVYMYTVVYHLNVLGIHMPGPLGECVYQGNESDTWDIPWYTMRER